MKNNFIKQISIPDSYKIKIIEQSDYLIGGRLQSTKNVKKVFSPISVYDENGILIKPYLGYYPDISSEEAMQVLHEAKNAYANGEGAWSQQ